MRLHNFCIDHRISEEHLETMDGEQGLSVPGDGSAPSRWEKSRLLTGTTARSTTWAGLIRPRVVLVQTGKGHVSACVPRSLKVGTHALLSEVTYYCS